MKNILFCIIVSVVLFSCDGNKKINVNHQTDWGKRETQFIPSHNLTKGKTYLPVYSQIYQSLEHKTYDLTVTVSIRNVSEKDTIYILSADYYNTDGEIVRNYFDSPIYLKPIETVEIVINESDKKGGTGGNFIFDWMVENEKNPPLFEAVMISTTGQQGLSFTTRGIRIFD